MATNGIRVGNGHSKNGAGGEYTAALMRGMKQEPAIRARLRAEGVDVDRDEDIPDVAKPKRKYTRRQPIPVVADAGDEAPAPEAPAKRGRKPKAVQEERVIELAPLRVEVIDVEIEGMTDLLQHRWDEKNIKEMKDKNEGRVSKTNAQREFRNPEAEYNGARYVDSKGRDCLPAVQFKKSMASVAAEKAISGVTKASIFRWITVTSLEKHQRDLVPIVHDQKKPTMREDMVRVGPFGKRVAMLRYRPSYSNWSCQIRIEFNSSVISAEMLLNLLNWSGMGIGIGEWRPEKSGEFGRFRVARTLNNAGHSVQRGNGRRA